MKILKALAVTPLVVMLITTVAFARGYGKGSAAPPTGAPAGESKMMEDMEKSAAAGGGEFFKGTLASIDLNRNEIVIKTEVPGLLGPQERDVAFRVDRDTTLSICFKSIDMCDSRATGTEGWRLLSGLEQSESLASITKSVIVVNDPEADRVVHVQIEYGI